MDIKKLSLKKFIKDSEIVEHNFDYAGYPGKAEIFAMSMVLFRKGNNQEVCAIAFCNIINRELISLANNIISNIGLGVKFGSNIDEIKRKYGDPFSIDNSYIDTIGYNYLVKPDLLVYFGVTNNRLAYLEIVNDYEMVQDIADARREY